MRLSGESPSTEPYPSETPVGDPQAHNQPESIEMVAIPETSAVSAHASPHRTPSTDPLSLITFHEPSSSTAIVTSAPLSVSPNSAPRTSRRTSSHNIEVPSVESLSPKSLFDRPFLGSTFSHRIFEESMAVLDSTVYVPAGSADSVRAC
ncbi:hypothetical protein BDN67DRAFT_975883 [Paxillus ammoniavirescens]|nr:hypothetical protein BDN67DRAFT_975883 [Paxillus ammoniavirescens]